MRAKIKITLAIIAIACSLSTVLIIGIIPMFQGKEILPATGYSFKHFSENGYYRLKVTRGYYYLRLDFSGYDIEPEIQVFSNSFKVKGISIQLIDWIHPSNFLFQVKAKHNGHVYLTIKDSKGAIFYMYLTRTTNDHYYIFSHPYTNTWKLATTVCSSLFIAGWGIFLILSLKEKSTEEKLRKNCPMCSVSQKKDMEYCTACGYIFTAPREYKIY